MLDPIDQRIVEKLSDNGRISLTELSDGAELSRVAIANRIDKLIQNGFLKVSAMLNLDRLNYQTLIVELQIENGKKVDFKRLVSDCPKVMQAFEMTGQFNHMLVCSSKSSNSLRRFVDDVLKKFAKDCRVTMASNPIGSEFTHIKSYKECEHCKKLKIE